MAKVLETEASRGLKSAQTLEWALASVSSPAKCRLRVRIQWVKCVHQLGQSVNTRELTSAPVPGPANTALNAIEWGRL